MNLQKVRSIYSSNSGAGCSQQSTLPLPLRDMTLLYSVIPLAGYFSAKVICVCSPLILVQQARSVNLSAVEATSRVNSSFGPIKTKPESTDGRREDTGRGVRKLQTRWSGLEFGKMRGWRRSAGAFGGADGDLQWLW